MNIGLIGSTGYWGKIIAPKLAAIGNVRFACSGRNVADYTGPESQVDWVAIATPLGTHYSFTEHFLSRGMNVLCEKPLTGDLAQSNRLFNLAEKQGVRLYVDDVFCFRNETLKLASSIDVSRISEIEFIWRKKGSFKDTIFNNMAYHDLSIAHRLFDSLNQKNLVFRVNEPDRKEFEMELGNVHARFVYDRTYDGKDKRIVIDGRTFGYSTPENDALQQMLEAVILGKADFKKNQERTLAIEKVLGNLDRGH